MNNLTSWIRRQVSTLKSFAKGTSSRETIAPVQPPRNFVQERETDRTGQMSADDRAWEARSLKRDQDARERQQEDNWDPEGGATAKQDRQD